MGSAGLAKLVWPGMVLAGFALAAFVWGAWPEPDGKSMPKTPRVAAPAQPQFAKPVLALVPSAPAPAKRQRTPAAVVQPQPQPAVVRVLAAVEPEPTVGAGPAPVASELELSGDYDEESPEELGAEPLPGAELPRAVLTPEPPPPVAR